jgi:hypothetical protein
MQKLMSIIRQVVLACIYSLFVAIKGEQAFISDVWENFVLHNN